MLAFHRLKDTKRVKFRVKAGFSYYDLAASLHTNTLLACFELHDSLNLVLVFHTFNASGKNFIELHIKKQFLVIKAFNLKS